MIQIGRFDIATAVMTLLLFRACPRQGHLDRVKRVIGYLSKFKHGVIRIRTDKRVKAALLLAGVHRSAVNSYLDYNGIDMTRRLGV